jgi:hypothetical protein
MDIRYTKIPINKYTGVVEKDINPLRKYINLFFAFELMIISSSISVFGIRQF